MKRYKAVLFDVDGTLIDLTAVAKAINEALEKNGYEKQTEKRIKKEMIGYPLEKTVMHLFGASEEKGKKVRDDYNEIYLNQKEKGNLYPYVEETIKKLREEGFKIGIVTTKRRSEALSVIETYPEIKYDVLIGGDDTERNKPDPDPIEKACEMLKINPKEAIYVGDHEVDVKAGLNAGCDVIAMTTGVHNREELKKYESENVKIIDDIKDIIPIALKEAEEIEKTLKIPKERIGALIGKKGTTKEKIEESTDVKIEVDSKTGEITVKRYLGRSPDKSIRAIDIVKAIGHGFSPRKAFKLLEPKVYIETIDISEHTRDSNKDIN
ncbi:MAG: HAD-IA family hydrolase, partial [archaeon]